MQIAVENFSQALERQHPAITQWRDVPHRFAYGTDASFYRLTPAVVVQANDETQVRAILSLAAEFGVSVTFRAAGTSLSGQAVTDSVLMLLGSGWQDIRIEQDGHLVHLNPGVIGAHANRALAPYGRKIGPDPASINSCKIGGIAANNASGMCCGTAQNTYHTLAGMRMILADGTLVDTRDPASVTAFKLHHADLLAELSQIMADAHANPALVDKIRHKYRIKNTTGYSLNALIDFDDPIDVLSHLMVGSEGTLGFIADIAYHTVSDAPFKTAILAGFSNIVTCCTAVQALKALPVSAVELIDSRGIKATAHHPSVPSFIGGLPGGAAALLIDVRGETAEVLSNNVDLIARCLADHEVVADSGFSTDPVQYEQLWGFRKGLFPALGAVRDTGTTVVIEDVAFPMSDLAAGVERLQACFDTHGYDDAFIFGHALEGNLHFVFSQGFATQQDRDRYEAFMADVTQLVAVEFGGSLKAEHGTGRNMAPFVALEWGQDAYQLMQRIKRLLDPSNLLNPGVLLNDDPDVHIKNLKDLPAANAIVDKCIECGFCETVCPSKNLTYTPRQRIVLWREISRLTQTGSDPALLKALEDSYWTEGLDSCAATGMCAERCPVGINTGELVKQQRQIANSKHLRKAQWAADHLPALIKTAGVGLQVSQIAHDILGASLLTKTSQVLNRVTKKAVPLWTEAMPRRARYTRKPNSQPDSPEVPTYVYWPSCVSQVMGPAKNDPHQQSQMDVLLALAERAGVRLQVPEGIGGVCCGQPFASKGFPDQAEQAQSGLIKVLQPYVDLGMTVVSDTSPCALRLSDANITLMDSMTFAAEVLLPRLAIKPLAKKVLVHVPCSAKRSGLTELSVTVAQRCADQVVVPHNIECCGFAGDKGFMQPELNASALQHLKAQASGCERGYSTSRTCEIGLSRYGGLPFQSLLYLIEEASR